MRIKIYQMESSDRTYDKKFFGIPKEGVDPLLYKNVFYGDVEAENLDDVYSLFNTSRPMTHQGHSLSVSDVVEVCNENEDLVTPYRLQENRLRLLQSTGTGGHESCLCHAQQHSA